MKLIDPNSGTVSEISAESIPDSGTIDDAKVAEALSIASDPKPSEGEDTDSKTERKPGDVGDSASVADQIKSDPALKSAAGGTTRYDPDGSLAGLMEKVEILQEHRDRFIDSVVTGERYFEDFFLMGGRISIRIRSRSSEETDAIGSYLRVMVNKGDVRTDNEYSSLLRKLMCIAQVERMNGVAFPTMEAPLLYEETTAGRTPPAWEPRIAFWAAKPDAVVVMAVRCIMEFEARYWTMIRNVDDENFWRTGESTGE